MQEKSVYTLKTDSAFKDLIRPLFSSEYKQLEKNILSDGCRDPIITWKGYIIDGHNRYDICSKHGIPFHVVEMEFDCKEAVIAWICANQLGRRNPTEETRKYLIGIQYESEKRAYTKRRSGIEMSTCCDTDDKLIGKSSFAQIPESRMKQKTANRIAKENHISHSSVENYAVYSQALNAINKKEPEIVSGILSGKYKITQKNVLELSHMSPKKLHAVHKELSRGGKPFQQYKSTKKEIDRLTSPPRPSANDSERPQSIKDMPAFDPDAELTALTLTMPSWASSLERLRTKTNFSIVSDAALMRLKDTLQNLRDEVDYMLITIEEI